MKFEIKPIEIKERSITVSAEIIDEYNDVFKSQAQAFEEDHPVFKESEADKLFDYLYENTPVELIAFIHTGETGDRVDAQYKFSVEEKVINTITPKIITGFAGKDEENYNGEILKQLRSSLKIKEVDPFELNVSFDEKQKYDVFIFCRENRPASKTYGIVHRKSKELTNSMLALLADWNLCFGFRLGNSRDINDDFKYQEIIIHTD